MTLRVLLHISFVLRYFDRSWLAFAVGKAPAVAVSFILYS
jgi:hypothetical protein